MTAVAIGNVGTERTRRRTLVFVLSILLHGLVLGWFAFRQDRTPEDAAAPAVVVQLLDVAKLPRPPSRADQEDALAAPVIRPVFPVTPRYVGPPASEVGAKDRGIDLFGPVFADGEWPRPWMRSACDPVADPDMTGPACQREQAIARGVNRAFDPNEGTDEFAREARRNEAVKRYRDAPGMSGYPGIRCHVLHNC